LWQRFVERHPNLAVPIKATGTAVGTWIAESVQGPLDSFVKEHVAEWTSHIAVVGPWLSEQISEPAGKAATGLAVGAVVGGVALWKKYQRRRAGEAEPETGAERIDRIERTATKADQQSVRANTRGDVATRQIGELQRDVAGLKAQPDSTQDVNELRQMVAALQAQIANDPVRQRVGQLEQQVAQLQADPVRQDVTELRQTVAAQQVEIRGLNDRVQSMTLDMGTLYHQQQTVQNQAVAAEQRAGTAEARAVLAQSEVTDVQAHQLLQDGRLDQHDSQLGTGQQPAAQPPSAQSAGQSPDPTYLPPDDAARLHALNARARRQREQSRQSPPGATPPPPDLRPPAPQPPPRPSGPTR
jgi:hypothetical protein